MEARNPHNIIRDLQREVTLVRNGDYAPVRALAQEIIDWADERQADYEFAQTDAFCSEAPCSTGCAVKREEGRCPASAETCPKRARERAVAGGVPMSEAREVYGTEARYARASADNSPTITLHEDGTRFYHEDGTTAYLKRGWYQVSRTGGTVLHWTHKGRMLREVGQLLRNDDSGLFDTGVAMMRAQAEEAKGGGAR